MTAGESRDMILGWQREGTFDERLPEVAALRGVPQPKKYHEEGDAFVHTMLALQAVKPDADERVLWATLLHDIGKEATTVLADGTYRSFGHAEEGARMVPQVLGRVGRSELAEEVAWLVRNHMFHVSWNLDEDKPLSRRQKKFLQHPLFPLLLQVCMADAAGSRSRIDKGKRLKILARLGNERTGGH